MTSVSRAVVECKIEWDSWPAGTLLIAIDDADTQAGSIAIDDTDTAAGVIATGDWTVVFDGAYDDVSSKVAAVVIDQGRDDLLTSMLAATATVTLRDPTGLLNHSNPASPIAAKIDDRMHPISIRLRGADAVWRPRFYGFTRRIRWSPTGRKGVATVECVDLTYWLSRAKPTIAATGPTTTGAAIGLILDSVTWADPNARVLADGDPIPGFSADGTVSGLELIAGLLAAERGVFYIDGMGRAIYEDRHARLLRASEATIADRLTHYEPEVDFDLVQNGVTVQRVAADGTVLYTSTVTDAASRALIGPSDADPIQSVYIASDLQADNLAAWLLPLLSDPTSPTREVSIDGRDPDLLNAILDLNLVDRFTATTTAAGGSTGDYHVEHFTLTLNPGGRLSGDYLVSRATTEVILEIAVDDADLSVGTIATDDADLAAGVIVY